MKIKFEYEKNNTLESRIELSTKLLEKYPDRKPVIIEKKQTEKNLKDITKNRYLLPNEMKLSDLIFIIRRHIEVTSEQSIFIFVNGHLVPSNSIISEIYNSYKNNDDQLLYIMYTTENTFGF